MAPFWQYAIRSIKIMAGLVFTDFYTKIQKPLS